MDVVVHHQAVGVVDQMALVAELHRLAQTSLADGPGIAVMERDEAIVAGGHVAGQAAAGLGDDPGGHRQGVVQVGHRPPQPPGGRLSPAGQGPASVDDDAGGVGHGELGEGR